MRWSLLTSGRFKLLYSYPRTIQSASAGKIPANGSIAAALACTTLTVSPFCFLDYVRHQEMWQDLPLKRGSPFARGARGCIRVIVLLEKRTRILTTSAMLATLYSSAA